LQRADQETKGNTSSFLYLFSDEKVINKERGYNMLGNRSEESCLTGFYPSSQKVANDAKSDMIFFKGGNLSK
jgi:hypothetical protein